MTRIALLPPLIVAFLVIVPNVIAFTVRLPLFRVSRQARLHIKAGRNSPEVDSRIRHKLSRWLSLPAR